MAKTSIAKRWLCQKWEESRLVVEAASVTDKR